MSTGLEAGAANCVIDCAGVGKGTRLFVVSEEGAVDREVADVIAAAGRDAGAAVETVWVDSIPKDTPEAIPDEALNAYKEGDIVISHFPSLTREALFPHFPKETRVRVPNRARTTDLLDSDWARFPYSVQRAIAERLEEKMAPGLSWRITSPAGTDVRGTFADADAGGEVGAAFFVDAGDQGRARKNFPGGVHDPRSSSQLDGIIIVEYMDHIAQGKDEPKLEIEVKDCRITRIEGGAPDGKLREAIARSDGWIDSWHAGVNPQTISPITRQANSRAWFGFSHCSPAIMHYHLGRTHETTNLASFGHTLVVDGETLYEDGALGPGILADPVVAAAIAKAGASAGSFATRPLAMW
ncbi:MAG TPA: hypothetical protein VLN73_07215 [Alphaproteobacteria bacterium]|nr:hypothetical protein [Alphaproteobacteria bacterium]